MVSASVIRRLSARFSPPGRAELDETDRALVKEAFDVRLVKFDYNGLFARHVVVETSPLERWTRTPCCYGPLYDARMRRSWWIPVNNRYWYCRWCGALVIYDDLARMWLAIQGRYSCCAGFLPQYRRHLAIPLPIACVFSRRENVTVVHNIAHVHFGLDPKFVFAIREGEAIRYYCYSTWEDATAGMRTMLDYFRRHNYSEWFLSCIRSSGFSEERISFADFREILMLLDAGRLSCFDPQKDSYSDLRFIANRMLHPLGFCYGLHARFLISLYRLTCQGTLNFETQYEQCFLREGFGESPLHVSNVPHRTQWSDGDRIDPLFDSTVDEAAALLLDESKDRPMLNIEVSSD